MKKTIGMLVALLVCSNVFSQGIEFEHLSFNEALAKAKAENKMLFMDCYTVWCGPCKALSKNVFPQKEVGEYYNANFVNLKMDMEKGEGPELLKKYDVKGFPTLLFLDAEGNVLYKRVGGTDPAGLIADAKLAADPTERLDYVREKYENGDRSKAVVSKYISLLRKNYLEDELKKVGAEFLSTLANEDLFKDDNFKTYLSIGGDYKSEKFAYVLENKEKFVALSDEQSVSGFIMMTYFGSLRKASVGNDLKELDELAAAYQKAIPGAQLKMMLNNVYGTFYMTNGMFEKLIDLKEKDFELAKDYGNEMYFNMLTSTSMQLAMNPKAANLKMVQQKIEEWTKKAMELQPESPKAYECCAHIYKVQGKKDLALKNINTAIDKVKASGKEVDQRILDLKNSIETL
ncbi:thioredoxin fold domain-containing protein [Marinifilum caeruleilacunae]|uniref:Thioredoxin family protein n=1 Tax=Marinifilum caeruleilacunae TaxID=2499076 RepID=A0ABX1X101_9BACT|nr:thioredoxin fold domain-containing protein [Marinifilum caeruleilacunae]NOU62073.1 thioredoxin family protein [Marinifilum caeruleilacunae]